MIRLILAVFTFACAGVGVSVAAAQPPIYPPAKRCSIPAWSIDRDPAGQNVRAGPSTTSAAVGRLGQYRRDPELGDHVEWGSSFDIVAGQNGWFYIRGAYLLLDEPGPDLNYSRYEPVEGWISGAFVRFSIQSEIGFERPDPESPMVWSNRWGERDFSRLLDCSGEWALVEWQEGGRGRSGWFRGICGEQMTSCDHARGDRLGRPGESRDHYRNE